MARMFLYRDVFPLFALIAIECINVSATILFKAATLRGMSYYVYIVYSTAVSTLVLLPPLPFILHRSTGLPSFTPSLLFRIFLIGVIGLVTQLLGTKAVLYSSPTLAAAMSNLIPAFTFILAVFFRVLMFLGKCMKGGKGRVKKFKHSGQNHGFNSINSRCPRSCSLQGSYTIPASSPSPPPPTNSPLDSSSPPAKWVLGGFLLLVQYLLVPIYYIVQTQVLKEYPAKLIVVFLYNLFGTIVSAPVCLMAEPDLSAWKLKLDITLLSIIYSGFVVTCLSCLIHAWCLHLKGPVYVSMFRPLSIAIATAMSVIFLGDALHLYSVIGSVILSVGFYGVIWGKAKEEEELKENYGLLCSSEVQPHCRTPLWQNYNNGEDKQQRTGCQ